MLCQLCDTFLTNILHQDLSTWRRVEKGWSTYKHGNYLDVVASAEAGCELCSMFDSVRATEIPNYRSLNEKWHVQTASIDVKYDQDSYGATRKTNAESVAARFQLLTAAPEMSWLAFELFEPDVSVAEECRSRDESPYPMAVSVTPKSSRTLSLAKGWTDDHATCHPLCNMPDNPPLPTRVIEVGYSDGDPCPRLQVNRGQTGRYVTLSHCWGTGSRLTLRKGNLNAFRQAIPFNQLSKTFQDAIRLSMSLGVRYLWIDALCIVQDDRDDWRRESACMGSVFENALFSISALAAEDSHSGMLQDRSTPSIVTHVGEVRIGVRSRIDDISQALQSARLETRAWCYQERLMSKAILWVAPDQLHWECGSASFSESVPWSRGESNAFAKRPESSTSSRGRGTDLLASESWLKIVSEYSSRQLTKPSDRLPAVAGLADRFQKRMGNAVYIQGLWSNDFHTQLLWRRCKLIHSNVIPSRDKCLLRTSLSTAERPRQPTASSFSWASLNDAVEYPVHKECPARRENEADALFEDVRSTSHHLELEGFVKRGSCKPTTMKAGEPDQAMFRPSGSQLVDDGLTCFLDYVDEPVSRGCYCLRIANWGQSITKSSKKKSNDAEQAAYLILERSSVQSSEGTPELEQSTFKRIGMGFDVAARVDKIFANADRRQLRLA